MEVAEPSAPTTTSTGPTLLARARDAGWKFWLSVGGICVLFVALRWNTFDAPLVRDEGEYAYAGQLLRHGSLPYAGSFLQKPPMVAYSYALAGAVAPKVYWAPRILAYLFAALATVLLGLIARWEFGKGAATIAMWLVTPMLLLPRVDQTTANTEMFLLLPLTGLLAIYCLGRKRDAGKQWWFAAGVLGALTILYKYTALPLVAGVLIAWTIEQQRRDKQKVGQCVAYGFFGILAGSIAALGVFVLKDGGWPLWECTVQFNRFYAQSKSFGTSGAGFWLKRFLTDWWILFVLPCGLFLRRDGRSWYWFGLFLLSWVTTAMSHYGQYYIVVMPFWALVATIGIRALVEKVAGAKPWSPWLTGCVTAGALALLCWPAVPTLSRSRAALERDRPELLNGTIVAAKRIAELTSAGDYVFVAGSEPQILSYAQRFSPTRFVITYPLMIPTPVAEKYQGEAIKALEQNPPKLIAFIPSGSSWLRQKDSPPFFLSYLSQLLANRYEPVGAYVVDAAGARWKEPASEQEFAGSSLRLFKLKEQRSGTP